MFAGNTAGIPKNGVGIALVFHYASCDARYLYLCVRIRVSVSLAGSQTGGLSGTALTIFCGMTVFRIFSECVDRAPRLIVNNPNYVKKVVFPLEILLFAVLGKAAFHGAISFVVLVAASIVIFGNRSAVLYREAFLAYVHASNGVCMEAWKRFSSTEADPSREGRSISSGICL